MIIIAKCIVVVFGVFFVFVGILMFLKPEKVRSTIRKAGSTNFINYTEITLRLIPAIALLIASDYSKFSFVFKLFGSFMALTSLVLYFVPRKLHHKFSVKASEILQPKYCKWISPFAISIGIFILYSAL